MPICNSGHRNYQRRHLQAINFELSQEPWQFADAISNPFHLPTSLLVKTPLLAC